jgi:hypothetical protein
MNRQSKKMMGAWILAAAAIAAGSSCDSLESTDLNNPGIESLTRKPTRSGILAASTGLVIGHRIQVAQTNGFVSLTGILGRESYCFDKADPRFITEMLEAPSLDASSPAFGGNEWQQPYQNIRNAFTILGAMEAVPVDPVAGVTVGEKAAITGFAETMQALDFLVIHNTRWTIGGPIDVNKPLEERPAPVKTKEEILAHVVQLLDDAAVKLATPGAAFPFRMGNGFIGFDTPETFLQFNRGIRARTAVYQQDWAAANTALAGSFLDDTPGTSLRAGVYHSFGTGSGDTVNNLVSPNILAHPKIVTEAEAGDLRVTQKLRQLLDEDGNPTTTTSRDLTTGYAFQLYPSPSSPISILRNEELILLRAEARFHLGDTVGANEDINFIRQESGGLGAVPATTDPTTFENELLKQRRYSLMFEGGHRWIDLRRLGRNTDTTLLDIVAPAAHPHKFHLNFPLPLAECLARTGDTANPDPSVVGKCL